MKLKLFAIGALIFFFTVKFASVSAAVPVEEMVDLDGAFKAALIRSETIANQQELIVQAEEHYKQALGQIIPNINGTASYLQQQPITSSAGGASIFPNSQPLVKLTLTQPLFQGFKEFAGLRQLNQLTDAASANKRNAILQLFSDVATNYYTVLSLEQALRDLNSEVDFYNRRIKELKDRVSIGRSRVNEVLTVQSSLASLMATIELTQGQLNVNREMFAFLTGLSQNTPIRDDGTVPVKVDNIDSYLALADQRPDIQSAVLNADAARQGVSIAKAGHLPSINLLADYYFLRSGFLTDVHWDAQVTLTIPIFAGGAIQSQVRQAVSQESQAELTLSLTRRQAEETIRSIHRSLVADVAQVDALDKAKDLAYKNYQAETHDYRLGLVTNLDVLTALTNYQEALRSFDGARYNFRLDYAKMEAAVARRARQEVQNK